MKRIIVFVFAAIIGGFFAPTMLFGETEIVDGIKWTYSVRNGEAWLGEGSFSSARAVPTSTSGQLVVPSMINGVPVVGINDFAFHSCAELEFVSISEGVRTIGDAAFIGCKRLKRITIPSTVEEIVISFEGNPFSGCSSLESIDVSSANSAYKSIAGVLYTKSGDSVLKVPETRKSITITEHIVTVPCGAFDGEYLESVELPSSVQIIQDYAFSNCGSLTSVLIPASVAKVGRYAFNGCLKLESLIFLGDCPLKEAYGWSVSPNATILVATSSSGWGTEIPGIWNRHEIRYLTAEQELRALASAVHTEEDLKALNDTLRNSNSGFTDKELRDLVYAIIDCASIDNAYINGDWLFYVREILNLPRMKGVLSEQDAVEVLDRLLPVALVCNDRDFVGEYALDNRLYVYSDIVSILGVLMPDEWRKSVVNASLDSLEKYEGKSMGLYASVQLFRTLSPELTHEEQMTVFSRVLAIGGTYDDLWESYVGIEDWAKAIFDDASEDVKMHIVNSVVEKAKISTNSVLLSVAIRLGLDWFGSIAACGLSLNDCVSAIETFDVLDEHILENLSEVMSVYDDNIKRETIIRIVTCVYRSIKTDSIVRSFANFLSEVNCELPHDVNNWMVMTVAQAIISAGPRRWVVEQYADLINAIGAIPADKKNWIVWSFVSMAKDEVGSYYTLCDMSAIISAIGEIPADMKDKIVSLCVDVSRREDVTNDAIDAIAAIIDALGWIKDEDRQLLISECSSLARRGQTAYARLYIALYGFIAESDKQDSVLPLLEQILKQENKCELLREMVDIASVVNKDLDWQDKDIILNRVLEIAENCEDPLQGLSIYCEVCRVFYGKVSANVVQPVLDRIIADLDVNHLGNYPIENLLGVFYHVGVECYDVDRRKKIVETVLHLTNQRKNYPNQCSGIKDLCDLLDIELSDESFSLVVENSYLSVLSMLRSDFGWPVVDGVGYVWAGCMKDQSGYSSLLQHLIADMNANSENSLLLVCVRDLLEYRGFIFERDVSDDMMRVVVSKLKNNERAILEVKELKELLYGWAYIADGYLKICNEPFLCVGDDAWEWKNNIVGFDNVYGWDLSEAMLKVSGKFSTEGREMSVWHDYVAGTDPTNPNDKFISSIEIVDGVPKVTWSPDLGGARAYTVLGSTDLKTWTPVESGRVSDYNFFKVSVEMK